MKRCEECGSWGVECGNEKPVPDCGCARCAVARRDELERALAESVKLQAHYAELLNMHDGGERLIFRTVEAWLERLRTTQ